MRSITDSLLAAATLISTGKSSGSGFLFYANDCQFLVTARHVLFNEENNFSLLSDEIELSCPTTTLDDSNPMRLQVSMKNAKYLYSEDSDVAIVLLGTSVLNPGTNSYRVTKMEYVETLVPTANMPLMIADIRCKLLDSVLISNDIFLFGYPTSLGHLGQYQYFGIDKPLLRKGIVSYINKQNKTIILDCPVYPGNSGGPIFEASFSEGKKIFALIGVVSKYIPYKQEWFNPRDKIKNTEYLNSGYSEAVAIDKVLELTSKLSPT